MKAIVLLALAAFPTSAAAHDAFGDIGAFYQGLLHPLADPAQGLIVVAAGVFLACHPLGTFRSAYLALVAGSVAAMTVGSAATLPAPGVRAQSLLALFAALYVLLPYRAGRIGVSAIAALMGCIAGLSMDTGSGTRAVLLGILGGSAGIAVLILLLWGALNWAGEHISAYAYRVAAAWIAAIGLMASVLPA